VEAFRATTDPVLVIVYGAVLKVNVWMGTTSKPQVVPRVVRL